MSFSRRGRPLAEEEKSTDAAKARARAMELLAGQELSSGQLYERLGRKFTQPTAAAVVAEMVERQYVDDERYARTRAHGLLAARKSRRAAAQNLRQKGLDAQQISAALEEAYAPDEAGGDPELEAAAASWKGGTAASWPQGEKTLWWLRWPGGGLRIRLLKKRFGEWKRTGSSLLRAKREPEMVLALVARG